jgi:hypothetical protein
VSERSLENTFYREHILQNRIGNWPIGNWPISNWPICNWPIGNWPICNWPIGNWPNTNQQLANLQLANRTSVYLSLKNFPLPTSDSPRMSHELHAAADLIVSLCPKKDKRRVKKTANVIDDGMATTVLTCTANVFEYKKNSRVKKEAIEPAPQRNHDENPKKPHQRLGPGLYGMELRGSAR